MHTGLLGCYMYNLISISKFRNSPSACLHQRSKFHHQVPFSKYKVAKFYINEFSRQYSWKKTHTLREQMQRILLTSKAWWWNLLIWRNHIRAVACLASFCMLPVLLAPTIFAMANLKNFWIADKVSQQCVQGLVWSYSVFNSYCMVKFLKVTV